MFTFEYNKLFAAGFIGLIAFTAPLIFSDEVFRDKHHHEEEDLRKAAAHRAYPIADPDKLGAAPAPVANAGPVGPEPILALLASADIAAGEKVTRKCTTCHSFEDGGANKVGPNLYDIVNAKMGQKPGYAYSSALLAMNGVWDYDALNHFFYKPKQYIEGTKMNFAGLKKAQDRANLIAYLRTVSASPAALPTDAEIAAEAPEPETAPAEEPENLANSAEPATDAAIPEEDIPVVEME